ncbi:MAG: cytochrome c [Myxococcales bacterium]|nr:MAG: cytochrome c [Myxococcales bacterium]
MRAIIAASLLVAGLAGCRGQESDKPPVHLNPNMDSQPRYDPQAESKFYEDRRTMRQPVEGTVARGNFAENDVIATGLENGQPVAKMPIAITDATLKLGQTKYGIYCTPCHADIGNGKGMVARRGFENVKSLIDDYARGLPDGQIYSAMANGVRTMPAYNAQLTPDERWAVVAYVRALQLSQNATAQDVPADKRGSLTVEAAK